MLDFMKVLKRYPKRNTVEIYPEFFVKPSKDLMIKGSSFYAIWDEEAGLWSTDYLRAVELIDQELEVYAKEHVNEDNDCTVKVLYLSVSSNGMIDKWLKYTTKQFPDNWRPLDEKLIFANDDVKRSDYASKRLSYPLENTATPNYDHLTSVLYSPEELHKIEWAIGAIITGDAKKIQKFEVLYGSAGTGKGTILEIVRRLFDGYYCTFEAKALGSANASFALEPFKNNPLVAIQFDGDLSKIEDNTRINSLVSHEEMIVNEKFKSTYTSRFKCFLFMGTNKPVRITDAKSGLIRRLIDVSPTGNKVPVREYNNAMEAINFELPGIAWHCREVYLDSPDEYQNYIPINMLGASNDFYNFVEDSYDVFKAEDSVTLKAAWERYKNYCEDAKVGYPYSKRAFKEELKNYFETFEERYRSDDGLTVYNLYSGFKFRLGGETEKKELKKLAKTGEWVNLECTESLLDIYCKDYPAQYSTSDGVPSRKWINCSTKLSDLKTTREHYVKLPSQMIVIDFDLKDSSGNKDREKNLEEASKWPPTYAEFSKSGAGVHLHYIYKGDTSKLANLYAPDIEIKVFSGNSALRRKPTYCNNLPIAEITTGLPLKGDKDVTNFEGITNEKAIRTMIRMNLAKKYHPGTKPSIDFIKKVLDDAYNDGIKYDVSDMRTEVLEFAANSTNHAKECIKIVSQMKFKSREVLEDEVDLYPQAPPEDPVLRVYDCEVYPNLEAICYKKYGDPNGEIEALINPNSKQHEDFLHHRLAGFNCRRYDNHICYAGMMGYTNEQLFRLSQRIVVDNDRNALFGDAYNASEIDIYDAASKKQSLKKWEFELIKCIKKARKLRAKGLDFKEISDKTGAPVKFLEKWIDIDLHHMEWGLPWDQPVPEELWPKVVEYCKNDVLVTEALYDFIEGDIVAREILADIAGGVLNDTSNTLSGKLIFGNNKKPQSSFNYRFLGDKPKGPSFTYKEAADYAAGRTNKKPEGKVWFPGYEFIDGKSSYRGVDEVGEGGRVYANPGSYGRAKTFDVASMHPHSVIAEMLFGEDYTSKFRDLVRMRVAIKHKDFDSAKKMFGGKLSKYLNDPTMAKSLAQALKIVINSVYGLTSAKFPNVFRDERNVDNIVAKRGALFMIDLQMAVEELGYKVIHVKTDSIKVADPDEFIENFIMRFGECYGYSFEVEDEWDRICLVNDAVYIGLTVDGEWKATGAEFQQPYVFKTLFTHEDLEFDDFCETKSVAKGAIYIDMEDGSDMHFVGRVGRFTPVKHGGTLYRVDNDKNYAVTGTKGYHWLESDVVESLGKEDDIDISYYENMAHDAMGSIIAFGNYADFVDVSKPYVYEMPESGEVPFINPPEVASLDLPEVFKR